MTDRFVWLLLLMMAVVAALGWWRWWRDVTRQKATAARMEQEAGQARRAESQLVEERARFAAGVLEAQKLESLGLLASGVAHDFNNLLGVIRGNAELLRIGIRRGRPSEEQVTAILDASDRARDLTRQILTFSRRASPTRELVDLSRVVRDLQPLLRRLVPRTIRLELEGSDQSHLIMGDPTQLQQLLLNLVANAEHAMRERTDGVLTVRLTTDLEGPTVVLEVCDTGSGILPEVRERLFEPFVTTKQDGEGTGLGLAVVHRIVSAHEGSITVSSEVGVRTCFTVRLPQAELDGLWDAVDEDLSEELLAMQAEAVVRTPPETVAKVATPRGGGPAVASARIVVVDDEPAVGTVVERSLVHYGHTVRLFQHPEQALAWITAHPELVDLLVTDQTMPGLTGDLLAEQARLVCPGLPVVIVTGFSHRLTPERVAAAGACRVLLKPVDMDTLQAAVEAALPAR